MKSFILTSMIASVSLFGKAEVICKSDYNNSYTDSVRVVNQQINGEIASRLYTASLENKQVFVSAPSVSAQKETQSGYTFTTICVTISDLGK